MDANKFSNVDDAMNETYENLEKFVHYLAAVNQDQDTLLMSADDIAGELFLELVKGVKYYWDKLDKNKLNLVLKAMLRNRIGELKYKFYLTHRKGAKVTISLDIEIEDVTLGEWITDGATPEAIIASRQRLDDTKALLSGDALRVFDALIYGNQRLSMLAALSGLRAQAVFKEGHINIKPWIVSQALLMPEGRVKQAFKVIKDKYGEVCND